MPTLNPPAVGMETVVLAYCLMLRSGTQGKVASMNDDAFEAMSLDELWKLHEQVTSTLARKITQQKAKLEQQLRRLEIDDAISPDKPRRPYPKVLPKYQNPKNPTQKWSGRGKQPRWVRAQLKAGKRLEHFRIA
jgi:DNA-binding protein H-NS